MNTQNWYLLIALVIGASGTLGACTAPPDDLTPLMQATIVGDASKVAQLVGEGKNVNEKDKLGNTALMHAAGVHVLNSERRVKADGKNIQSQENTNIVKLLLKAGDDPNVENQNGATPLTAAIFHGRVATVTVLAKSGADVNRINVFGYTPLMYASMHCFDDIAAILLEHGASPNVKGKYDGKTALDIAADKNCESIAKRLRPEGIKK